ncbi:hypothetical protein B0A52_02036 [Exophiala mesophila]|uniref:Ubiquitin-activating enzyme E1-like n=1 Tax=Exophiala mesophila TaxID=212818 RepID=A0A438NET6_EXOME|nr:hypothetical protein B0A52_02036 [Exophiala mesophila]
MPRETWAKQSLGATHRLVKESRVLLVGAGGIGCELLKNLVLTGFGEIHIIDLDTIDLSNLNRQFLFRHEHIKKPKAIVAKEVAQAFNKNVTLVPYHANIKDKQFNFEWFSSFNLVFNALDNMDARKHVNKMCLAVDVPLIESGTTGFRGQVQVIKKGQTACYDCTFKSTPVTYPVCTIRSTPSQPIHCIVWAKSYLLPELFGTAEDEAPDLDTAEDSENAKEIQKLKEEAQALKKIRESMGSETFTRQVFDKVFSEDIQRLASMEDMWKTKSPPQPLSWDSLEQEASSVPLTILEQNQTVWSRAENFVVFKDSLERLAKRLAKDQAEASKANLPAPLITFDKDDDDTLDFVIASANLRAIIFGIDPKSKFDTKQMAGNIIPAIATTNAMVAGLCAMEAFKVLRQDFARTKYLWLRNGSLSTDQLEKPNPECPVCNVVSVILHVDLEKATLKDLVHDILKTKLGYGDEMTVMNDAGIIYDPDLEDNLERKLTELGIDDASFILVKDDEDEPRVDLQLAVLAKPATEGQNTIAIAEKEGHAFELPKKPKKDSSALATDVPQNDGAVMTNGINATNGNDVSATSTIKRKRALSDAGENGTPVAKKFQGAVGQATTNDAIVIDEDDGTLVIADD